MECLNNKNFLYLQMLKSMQDGSILENITIHSDLQLITDAVLRRCPGYYKLRECNGMGIKN